jgi:uncharacterized damage-inducible protein DinB
MASALSFGPGDARTMVRYNHKVFDRFVRRIRRLSWKEVTRRRGIGHETLFQTLVHILNVQEVWLVYIVRGRTSDAELEGLFRDATRKPSTWSEFDVYLRRVWSNVNETMRWLTRRKLDQRVQVFWMPGRYTVRDAVLQATLEEAHHLGEVIGALWQDERKPPDMTWLDIQRALSAKA